MHHQEKKRLFKMIQIEKALLREGFSNIVGVDEAGRGPLAGPVVAACCLYHPDLLLEGLDDSKKLTPLSRHSLYQKIITNKNIQYGVAIVDSGEIDQINILQATLLAMKRAIEALNTEISYLIVDGNQLPNTPFPAKAIIKGDQYSISIAAASIIAKETRDELMNKFHQKFPEYFFNEHKGYGTKKHKEALLQYGPCPIHRKSFRPISELISIS